jgi:exopolyphosphatase/guanosine-5'-triphosphate,3'-diphosphate pyrophosphatase
MRDARNGPAFQAWVKAETGWNLEIISGLEEGRLIHRGVMANEAGVGGRVLLVDLGGGSCEITLSERKRIKETISVPLGAVRLTEEFLTADPAPADGLGRMRRWIGRELRRAHRRIQPAGASLVIATSGTAAALSEAIGGQVPRSQKRDRGHPGFKERIGSHWITSRPTARFSCPAAVR